MKKVLVCLGVCGVLSLAGGVARAGVSQAYLFSEFGGNPGTPAFSITGTAGVELFLNGSGVATGQADLGADQAIDVLFALQYQSHTGTINSGEAAHTVDSEIGVWDDVGVVSEGVNDALLNIDYGDGAAVTFKPVANVLCLVVAEDAGLDPFKLEFDDGLGGGFVTLFDGFDAATQTAILNRADFGSDDSAPDIDQVYIFAFDEALSGTFRITESTNPNGTKLEIDFVGACVPEPTTGVLVAASLGLAAFLRRRQR